jgi:hypothetical protein
MKNLLTLLKALLLVGVTHGAALSANTEVPADADEPFSYETSHTLPVDISLANSGNKPMLLSFYSKGQNGLRLLENLFTDAQGHYVGQLRLPIHLQQVTLVVRGVRRQSTLVLGLNGDSITYAD